MKRTNYYMQKTLKELIEQYEYENDRIDKRDAFITQQNIVNEVYARVKKVFDVLNSGDNVNIDNLYNEFLQPSSNKDNQ